MYCRFCFCFLRFQKFLALRNENVRRENSAGTQKARVVPIADERPTPKASEKGSQKGSRKARRQQKPQPLKKAAKRQKLEEGSQASKAEVAALKRQLKALTDQLEREILRADNLQHQFDIIRLEQQLYPAAPRQAREDAGNGEN